MVPPETQGTYGSPETPPLKRKKLDKQLDVNSGEPRFLLKPPPLLMLFILYLILIIWLTSSCFL